MLNTRVLRSARLDLIPMTLELAAAEQGGKNLLGAALDVPEPPAWPPDLYDADDLERFVSLLGHPANAGWALYYLVQRGPPRTLVGVAGFEGRPTADRELQIGYSIVSGYRRMGLATEAVAALVDHAFRFSSADLIVAETFPTLPASIRVLERNGFERSRRSGRGGALRYERRRVAPTLETP